MAYSGVLNLNTDMDVSGLQKSVDMLSKIVKRASLAEKGFEAVARSIDGAVSRYDALNRFPKVLENMGYSAEESAAAIRKLEDGVQDLPTSLDEIVATAQRLTILTGNLEESTDMALALNNAFYASGATAADASRGLTQYMKMLSSGKVDMISWGTLQETMGYALNKTAEAFGFAGASAQNDLYAALRDGDVTFTEFNAKIIELNSSVGGFAEMAKASTGGIGTAYTNMKTQIVAGATEIIAGIDRGLSETKFKSIENVISSTGNAIKSILTSLAGAFEFAAMNIQPLTIGVISFAAAWKGVQLLSYVQKLGSVTAALKALAPALLKVVAAKVKDKAETIASHALYAKDAIVKAASTVATKVNAAAEHSRVAAVTKSIAVGVKDLAAKGLAIVQQWLHNAAIVAATRATKANIAATNGGIVAKIAAAAASNVAAAAQWLWNASMKASTIGLIIAGVAALVVGIVALVGWLSSSSEEYKKQKAEVKALAEAQKELAASIDESAAAYKISIADIAATAVVSKDLVNQLKQVQSSSESAEDKHRKMAETVAQLNTAVDGLNVVYDEETGAIRNVNTGQELSIEQLEELVSAKAELAHANAWQERANELVAEQVNIQKKLAAIELEKQEIMSRGLSVPEQERLIKKLDKTVESHMDKMVEVEAELEDVNENLSTSNTAMADSIVSDYERLEQAFTSSGESIEEVAAQWNVSVDEILAAMEREDIGLDGWVSRQKDAWAEYEASVKERAQGVINSFREIPGEYDKSATEMLETLQSNKERYAEWEIAMAEITRLLGPTAAAEFEKLGPEATSAMQEILDSTDLLDEYRELFGVKVDEATGYAVEDWNNSDFIGAASGALDTSAQMVTENTALATAVTGQMEGARTAAELVEFTEVGQGIAADIVGGMNSADVSGVMNSIVEVIQNGSDRIISVVASMSSSVQDIFHTLFTQMQSMVSQMMTSLNLAVVTCVDMVKSSAMVVSSSIVDALQWMIVGAEIATNHMMNGMLLAMNQKALELYDKAREIANKIASTLASAWDERSPSRVSYKIMAFFMQAMYNAMGDMSGLLFRKADGIADGLTERLTISPEALVEQLRALTAANQLGGTTLMPLAAGVGAAGGVNYSTNLIQNITTPKPLSASEMTREGQDLLRRQRWQLP